MLRRGRESVFLTAARDGVVLTCNAAFAELLMRPESEVVGRPLSAFLPEDDAAALRRRIDDGRRDFEASFLLNFVDAGHSPLTLVCRIDIQPRYVVLFGEAPRPKNQQAQEELLQMNNQLAVLSRENARKNKELERAKAELAEALEDLRASHWHLRKLQEVLPICMECGKVKAGVGWQNVVEYLKNNALFLSHGYCPECTAELMTKWSFPAAGEE